MGLQEVRELMSSWKILISQEKNYEGRDLKVGSINYAVVEGAQIEVQKGV